MSAPKPLSPEGVRDITRILRNSYYWSAGCMVEKATLDLAADMLDAARARIAELGDERDRWEEVVKRHVARIAELEHALACISKAPSQSMARRIACQAETEEKP